MASLKELLGSLHAFIRIIFAALMLIILSEMLHDVLNSIEWAKSFHICQSFFQECYILVTLKI